MRPPAWLLIEEERIFVQPTLLIVDDDPIVRKLISLLLAPKGYALLSAEDGETALTLLRDHAGPVDLLIVDLSLPGLGGAALSEKVSDAHPEAQVLFISGYGEEEARRHFKPDGFPGHFLAKPFLISDLIERVEAILSGTAPEEAKAAVFQEGNSWAKRGGGSHRLFRSASSS